MVYLMFTLISFVFFMFLATWFVFFNEGPVKWMQSKFYVEPEKTTAADKKDGKVEIKVEALMFVQENIKPILIGLGLFCALVAYVLFISM